MSTNVHKFNKMSTKCLESDAQEMSIKMSTINLVSTMKYSYIYAHYELYRMGPSNLSSQFTKDPNVCGNRQHQRRLSTDYIIK